MRGPAVRLAPLLVTRTGGRRLGRAGQPTDTGSAGYVRSVAGGDFLDEMRASGTEVSQWSNAPGDTYGTHSHSYRKLLCCLEGSIVFHLAGGDENLRAGDRLLIEAGVEHAATVGPDGVRCAEAHLR